MLMSVVACMLLGLSDGQTGKLSIINDRLTYGHLGPVREAAKYLPGDAIHLCFDVQNITFDAKAKAIYAVGMQILDAKNKEVFQQKPHSSASLNYLGGNTLACSAHLHIPFDTAPGQYTLRVTVVDNASKQSISINRKVEVLPKAFGLVDVGTSADREAAIAWSPVGVVGDSIYLNFSAVGFGRDPKSKQPNIKVSMRVLDEKGVVTTAAKISGEANSDVAESMPVVPMQFGVTLNRVGRFVLELTATDVVTGKTSKVAFPVRVFAP